MALVFNKIMAKVSIIVPIYNVEKYLDRCIKSLINQTLYDIEIVLVNDGSTDSSKKIAEKYSKIDNRIVLINKENEGGSIARNTGLNLATGEYIMFLDSDDYYEPNCVEESFLKIVNDGSDVVVFGSKHIDEEGNIIKEIIPKETKGMYIKEHPEILMSIENCTWDKIYKSSLFKDNHLKYPENLYYQDFGITFCIMANVNKISFTSKTLINYIVNRKGSITSEISDRLYDILKIVEHNINYYKSKDIYDIYYEEIKAISIINIIDKLKIAIKNGDKKFIKNYTNSCYKFMIDNFGEIKSKKYNLSNGRFDFIYSNPILLKIYLLIKKGVWL